MHVSVTIKDVAKKANVAPSTVSRVISDSPRISEKTKRRVRKVMDELGYHLNYNGRVLVSQSTQTIGIVTKVASVHSFDNPFFSELLRGISDACHEKDYSIYLTTGNTEESIYREVVKMVQGKRVDGVIVLYSREDDNVVPYLRECNFPFVMIGKPVSHTSDTMFVDNDNVQASKEVTDYLIGLGHQKIGFIGGDSHYEVARDRLSGFKLSLSEQGLELPGDYLKNIQSGKADAETVVEEILQLTEPPTGIVITDDYNSMKVMRALEDKGIRLPDEMSIVGFNNTMIARLSKPPLTTVDTQSFQLGHESARSLIELLNHPDMMKKSIIIPTVIVERESCIRLEVQDTDPEQDRTPH
ncbi:LacI family transcription regulator [Halobacillus halophilus DSM 2266]|uniref:LacI family transcription regulator n=1 Tax=Halobacillus halophilus (strain ATCC 35676 / DSM 2266 / JCM 20832 / KCTC 3685 / LMG 17431 / NBRC 102448 / NCIMB 2269) TaxID=866895 RepID=I0JRX5_HALH3|nr:LacI family transcription regulator [Halobacillus halophilus DSM 2266]